MELKSVVTEGIQQWYMYEYSGDKGDVDCYGYCEGNNSGALGRGGTSMMNEGTPVVNWSDRVGHQW